MTVGTRVRVIRSNRGNVGREGVIAAHVYARCYPYLVTLDGGPTIWTNDLGIEPI
jgi:hypothetical protein